MLLDDMILVAQYSVPMRRALQDAIQIVAAQRAKVVVWVLKREIGWAALKLLIEAKVCCSQKRFASRGVQFPTQ